ncbi:L-piperidine-6-carboxylate dehydrogenase [Sulfitobacter geojensis]|uniref:L-piperidine-6-carboxylate dehydrogenase n=1 Tax=Sulfitobacter geojensis TaxID=1342299 RepID=UPI0007D94D0B|nr:aldehyde dehydrogenase family protein [Sulfitobacter geojensis]OAN92974.1 aldehyde dehydrogenase [Sulfitobacter geojensis]
MNVAKLTEDTLNRLGVDKTLWTSGALEVQSPVTGKKIAKVHMNTVAEVADVVANSKTAFAEWRKVPAPRRGELIRLLGEELRSSKEDLGKLVSIEAGKSVSEGQGEVQEMIDICDFAVGLSRQLYGLTIATERPGHRMMEQWHPLGVVGVISAFNFPVAVWSWNTALALVCGNPVIWKPSEKSPLTALASMAILGRALARFGDAPKGLVSLINGRGDVGAAMVENPDVALISATGSTRMGRLVAPKVAERFGRSILELGGNNAGIVAPSADLDMTLRGVAFGAMGTAGQRCTTLRRLFVHTSVYDQLVGGLRKAYESVSVGNPLDSDALVGPLIDRDAFDGMQSALDAARKLGGKVTGGERVEVVGAEGGFYARPALVEMPKQSGIVCEETFAPILYVMKYDDLSDAVTQHNAVGAGLSSCIFTLDMREAETFISTTGSDCGIANINIATSGAEIGGAFGGEKETGGGRESGSDAWKGYMRRATNTINYSAELPLAQGVSFDI